MLVLSRRKNERVMIGNAITVTVVDIRENSVRLGFEAPPQTSVNREEVQQRIDAEKQNSGH